MFLKEKNTPKKDPPYKLSSFYPYFEAMYQVSLQLLSLFYQSELGGTLLEENTKNKVKDITRQILEQISKGSFPKNEDNFVETFAYVYLEWGKKSDHSSHVNFFITQIACIKETFTIYFPKENLSYLETAIIELQDHVSKQKIKN